MSRIMIAATGSGVGKTTVICGLLNALRKKDKKVVSFKCGPDYIDPMFHKKVTEVPSKNLDIFLMGEDNVKNILLETEGENDIAIIEGVMGLYDGLGQSSKYSANDVSQLTNTPIILVVNPKGKAISLCAEIKGFLEFQKNNIKGILLNNIKSSMYSFYKNMIETNLDTEVVGFIPTIENAMIESRYLGLITANEIKNIQKKIDLIGDSVLENCDINKIIEIANSCEEPKKIDISSFINKNINISKNINIYVAKDEAFNFIYDDNIKILEELGANIKYFSPIYDDKLPYDAHGILLFGGYPEIYANLLENNIKIKNDLVNKINNGLPTYAECGGFMYLQKTITDFDGYSFDMLGVLDGDVIMTKILQNFGYTTIKSEIENNFLNGEINTHSFHHSKSTNEGDSFLATKISTKKEYKAVVITENIFASYLHIHFLNNLELPKNFISLCDKYKRR